MTEKNVETPAETKTETLQHEDVETNEETDDYLNPSTINSLIHARVDGGKSLRTISEESGISLATVSRILKGVNMKLDSSEIPIDGDETTVVSHPSAVPSPSTPETRTNYVLRPGATAEEFKAYMKQKKEDLISENINLKAQVASLQGVGQTGRGNGEGHSNNGFGSENYIDALGRLVDKLSMQKQAEKVVDRMFPSEKKNDREDNELSRRLDRIETKLDSAKQGSELLQVAKALTELARPNQPGRDPAQDILLGNQMRSDIEKNVQSQYSVGVQKSRIDLEIEAMQQGERLDYKRLEYDERRADKKEAADNKKWEFAEKVVKFLGSDHAGAAIEAVGTSMADKIRGSRVPMTTVICPHCTGKFRTNPELPHAMCPNCGAMLDKPTQPQPRAEPETETPNPETEPKGPEQPSEEPQEQKPKIDITSDQGVKNE